MFKKTAIALSLAMVAGTGFAAQNGTSAGMNGSASVGAGGANASMNSSASAEFRALDTNGDGVISRTEASKSPALAKAYDSFDTSGTIEDKAKNGGAGGITPEQFQAGMQAAHSKSGVVGDAVSGGETYTMMKDGTQKLKGSTSAMKNRATTGANEAMSNDAMSNAKARTMGSDRYDGKAEGTASAEGMKQSGQSMMKKGANAEANARSKVKTQANQAGEKARTMGSDAYDGASNKMNDARMKTGAKVEQRTGTPTNTGVGIKAETEANY